MMSMLGLPLEEALGLLREKGIDNVSVTRTQGRKPSCGTERIVRISEDGRAIVTACFPDQIKNEGDL